jgi:hypothetical protein
MSATLLPAGSRQQQAEPCGHVGWADRVGSERWAKRLPCRLTAASPRWTPSADPSPPVCTPYCWLGSAAGPPSAEPVVAVVRVVSVALAVAVVWVASAVSWLASTCGQESSRRITTALSSNRPTGHNVAVRAARGSPAETRAAAGCWALGSGGAAGAHLVQAAFHLLAPLVPRLVTQLFGALPVLLLAPLELLGLLCKGGAAGEARSLLQSLVRGAQGGTPAKRRDACR